MLTPDRVRPLSSWLFGTSVAAVLLAAGLTVSGMDAAPEQARVTPKQSKALEESLEQLDESRRQLEELTASVRESIRPAGCPCG